MGRVMLLAVRFLVGALFLASAALPPARAQGGNSFDAAMQKIQTLYSQGRTAEAAAAAEQALKLAEEQFGKDDPRTLGISNNLAVLYHVQRRYGEAERHYLLVLKGFEQLMGADDTATLTIVNNIAELYKAQGRNAEAVPYYQRQFEASQRKNGESHPETLQAAAGLAGIYQALGRFNDAAGLSRQVYEGRSRMLGRSHPDTLESANQLGLLYIEMGRYQDAAPLLIFVLEARERKLGKDHTDTLSSVANLAALYKQAGRFAEAEQLYKRALEAETRTVGPSHNSTLITVHNLAMLFQAQGRPAEAEPLFLRALKGAEQSLGKDDPFTLSCVSNLGLLYVSMGRYAEAEPLYRRALDGITRVFGEDHPRTATIIHRLADIYMAQGNTAGAEPLFKRALEGRRRALGEEHPDTLSSLHDLAKVYEATGRYAEAAPLYVRVQQARERVLGAEHPDTLSSLDDVAGVLRAQKRNEEAIALYKRVIGSMERVLGKDHPDTLAAVNSLANLYLSENRFTSAGPLYQRAVSASEKVLGASHPHVGAALNNLSGLYYTQGDWRRAVEFGRRSASLVAGRTRMVGQGLSARRKSESELARFRFSMLVKAASHLERSSEPSLVDEMFRTAQWSLNSQAALSLIQMAARGARGDGTLAALVRERQDRVAEWQGLDERRLSALAQMPGRQEGGDARGAGVQDKLAAIEARIGEIDKRLDAEFPDYAVLVSPSPLSVAEAQALLREDEALALFLDTEELKPAPEETFVWVITKTGARWGRSTLGTAALTGEVQALRCGLDEEEWATPTKARHCAELLGYTDLPDPSRPLPFNAGRAYELYRALFGRIEDLVSGKRLLIVPSGPLAGLPFHVLVTKKPETALPSTFEGYRDIAWLGRSHSIATLPAVSSLKALRQFGVKRQVADEDYAGYGNPVLLGDSASCRAPKVPDACPVAGASRQAAASGATGRATIRGRGGRRSANLDGVFAKGAPAGSVLEEVRALCPLPDTAYEIKCVAEHFNDKRRLIRLDKDATKAGIKALSGSGELARYRILHFATHGLVAGDVEAMAKRRVEPALVLTPPENPADAEDNGLLMASDVTGLQLNADWAVLSACNTAAGGTPGGEALSGLARAFFYAGARTLLVSHWPVYSDAAVRLTTGAFAELDRDPEAGRAEAFQRSMIALMEDTSQADNAHPAVWAPFVVVGEGGK